MIQRRRSRSEVNVPLPGTSVAPAAALVRFVASSSAVYVAIFQEPVRSSRLIRAVVRYRESEVSPFQRPLSDDEPRIFCAPFRVS